MRLLRNKAHQGTERTSKVIDRVPVVPDLNDSIDFDGLLLEAGLIKDLELHDDTATGAYCLSAQALGRSTDATNTRRAKRQPCMARLMNWNCFTAHLQKVKDRREVQKMKWWYQQHLAVNLYPIVTSSWALLQDA